MKIIINQPRSSYFVGGGEMISFDHALNMYKLGNEVYFFTIDPKSIGLDYSIRYLDFYKKYNNKIHFIELEQNSSIKYIYDIKPGEDRCRWNVESIFYNHVLYDYLKSDNKHYDVIFSYYNLDAVFVPNELIDKNILYLCGVPKTQNDYQGSFLYAYDKVIAISDDTKESWKKYAINGINVISTGVDTELFDINNNKEHESINLLFVGRLISRKNVDLVIKAYKELKKDYDITLTIVGDGPEIDNLKKISKDCIFTGVVNNTYDYYNNSDIFISPSEYGEGLQGTILEAMSCGLTVVATDTKITSELLNDNRGVLVNPNVDSVIDGIKKAILIRDNNALSNRNYIVENYSWETKVKELLEEFK